MKMDGEMDIKGSSALWSLRWQQLLENLARDEEETGSSRNAVLQKNSIDGASKQQESLKANGNKKDTLYHNQKETAGIY